MVRYLVNRGHTVFMVSWRNPQAKDWDIGMDDYLNNGVLDAIRVVSEIVPRQKIQAVGYCLGGTLLSIAAALMARKDDTRLKSLTLLASQVDFTEPGELALFIDDSQLTFLDGVMSDQGFLDGKQMAGAFTLLNQRDLVFSRLVRDYWLGQRAPVTDLMAWNADATRMPYRQHSHYLHSLYRHNDLAEGRYIVEGRPVVLRDVRLPVFCLGTQRDTVSPWRSVYKLQLFTSTELTFCLTSGGHNVGVVNPPGGSSPRHYQLSRRKQGAKYLDPDTWAAEVAIHPGSWWPAWAHWLEGHAGPLRKAPIAGDSATGYGSLGDAPGRYVLEP
jgi:polyhydroxyalkanoate synthase